MNGSIQGQLDFRALFEALPGLYLILKPDFTIVAASDSYLDATMTKRDEMIGRNLFQVFPDNPDDPIANGVSNLRASLERVIDFKSVDPMPIQKYDIKKPQDVGGNFETRYWSPVNAPILGPNNEIQLIIHKVEDVTELISGKSEMVEPPNGAHARQMSKLRQAQRMEAMGQLAGGVAHDFNNILSIIMMNCELVNYSKVDETVRRRFEQIKKVSERAASLTRQLLAFSRRQILQPQALQMNAVMRDLEALLSRLLSEDIRLKSQLAEKLDPIWVDRGQLEQIIINLVVNSRDAVGAREGVSGEILIKTANVEISVADAAEGNPKVEPGDYVMISVGDNGEGMTPEIMNRLFEPFFTTKDIGKGTGLGLATVHGIVNQSGGTIRVKSVPNKGSEFQILFPKHLGKPEADAAVGEKTTPDSGTILVVEDQNELRDLISESLKLCGFTIHSAENGAKALELVAKFGNIFDLVITDVVMPEMGGKALAEALRASNKDIRVLYLSGYNEESLGESATPAHFLEKPFPRHVLLEKVRKIIAEGKK